MTNSIFTDCPLFKDVEKSFVDSLTQCCDTIKINKGDYIFHQDDLGNGMYVVLSGKLDVIIEGKQDNIIASVERGSFFGEVSLLTEQRRTAAVKATEDAELLFLQAEKFRDHVKQNNPNAYMVCHNISIVLAKRLEMASELITTLYKTKNEPFIHEIESYKKKLLSDVLL